MKILKRLSLIATAFSGQLIADPNGLFKKITERLRTHSFSINLPHIPSPSPEGERLLKLGELTASVHEFEAQGLRGRWRARQVKRQLEELATPISSSVSLSDDSVVKNVVYFLTNSVPFTRSGYTERSQKILKVLQENGLNVYAVTRLGYPVLIGRFSKISNNSVEGVNYSHLLPWRYPWSWSKRFELAVDMLVKEASRVQADILHTTTDYKNAIITSHAAREMGIPWVYETRGELQKTWLSKIPEALREAASQSEFYRKASAKELEAMGKASAVISLSEISKANFSSLGIPVEKITVVPNAIAGSELSIHFDKAKIRSELGLPNEFIVGTVTSVVGYEGLDDLLRGLKVLDNVFCLIVGDGEARPSLEILAQELKIQHRVIFVGKQPSESIWRWYAALDAFVVPRKDFEVCRTVTPIKSLRAQALGVPVIASDLPALREVTGNIALYSVPESAKSIADNIDKVRNLSSDELAKIRNKGRGWVQRRTWKENARQIGIVYRRL